MKPSSLLLILFFFLFSLTPVLAQNGTCLEADVLCFDEPFIIFENCFNGDNDCTDSGEVGPDYGCLGSTPFPNWKLIEIAESGDVDLQISQNTSFDENGEPTGNLLDIDFIVYGPFSNTDTLCDYSNLIAAKIVDCSFSAAGVEILGLPISQAGERYVLMTTNFSGQQASIKIEQIPNEPQASLACELSTEFITSCEGETVVLDNTPQTSGDFQYQWEVLEDDVFVTIPGETDATLSVILEGIYKGIVNEGAEEVSESQYNVTFVPQPVANNPETVNYCDGSDNDGFVTVNLNTLSSTILEGQTGLQVQYYLTQMDADTNSNPVGPNFSVTTQTLFARISPVNGDCFDTTSFDIVVSPSPQLNQPTALLQVDAGNDGVEVFDLTVNLPEILNGQDPSLFDVSYYLTPADAQNENSPIAVPTNYENTSLVESIYVRVTSIDTGCFGIIEFSIVVQPDTDGDGVPDFQEDINDNGDLTDDDTDDDGTPDYQDEDDDGDSVDTAVETMGDGAGAINVGEIDTDNDGIFNYLDDDDDGDGILTIDEDYNGNGTPLDDDTNGNNLPDFLDAEVALSISAFAKANLSIFPNPVSRSLRIEGIDVNTIETAVIYDLSGKRIFQSKELTNSGIEVSTLSNGIYFLKLISGNESLTKRFIKQ